MSVEALRWLYAAGPPHTGPMRAVAQVLAWHHTAERGSFPKRETIVTESCLSDGAVGKALRLLEAEGTIRRDGFLPRGGTVIWRFPAIDGPARDAEPAEPGPAPGAGPARDAVPHDALAGSAPGAESIQHDVLTIERGTLSDSQERPGAVEAAAVAGPSTLRTPRQDRRRASAKPDLHQIDMLDGLGLG